MTRESSSRARQNQLLRSAAEIAPAAVLVVVWVVWATGSGGYFPRDWYPPAMLLVGLLALATLARASLPRGRAASAALVLFGCFVAWSFASITWADAPGDALEAADKLLLYFASTCLLCLLPWSERRAAWMLGAWCLGVAAVCGENLVSAAAAEDPTRWFIEDRYADPLGYAGASGTLAGLVVWPAVMLSARRETPLFLKGVFLAVAAFLIDFALLPQSRAAALALAVSAIPFLLLAPDRGRLAGRGVVLGATLAVSLGPVLDVFSATDEGGLTVVEALDSALGAMALAAGIALAGGVLVAFAETRLRMPAVGAKARRGALAVTAVVAAAALVVALVNAGSIASSVSDRWDAFLAGEDDSSETSSRFTSTGDPQRHDYWRVALELTGEEPITGIGAGNYELEYTARREEEKHSRYAHDIWLRTSSETGLVGLALLVGFLGALLAALLRARRAAGGALRAHVAAAVAVLTCFLVHASLDWVDEFPVLAAPALGLPFVALKLVAPPERGGPRIRGRPGVAGVAALFAVAIAALALPYTTLRYVERAADDWRTDPSRAYEDLDRAAALNPLTARPYMVEGRIAASLTDQARARRAYRDAIDREDSWHPHFELALLAASTGRFEVARREIDRAAALNPTDPLVKDVAARIRRRQRVDPVLVHRRIQRESRERFRTLDE